MPIISYGQGVLNLGYLPLIYGMIIATRKMICKSSFWLGSKSFGGLLKQQKARSHFWN